MNASARRAIPLSAILAWMAASAAGCDVDVSRYVGWEILSAGRFTGYADDDGTTADDYFKGCDYGRVLIIDGRRSVTCRSFSYSYSYRPQVVILSDGFDWEACIDDEMYRIERIRW